MVFLHYFEVPEDLTEQALSKKVLEEASKVIPVAVGGLQWDFIVVENNSLVPSQGHTESEKEPVHKTVLFIGTPKEIVDDYKEVCYLAGLTLVALDIESMSLGRAFLSLPETKSWLDELENEAGSKGSTMIVDSGARTTTISIFDRNQILMMSVNIPIAGERFTEAVQEKLGVSGKEAEELKRTIGFDGSKGEGRVFAVLQAEFQKILEELRTIIQYYEHKKGERIERVILAGGSSLLPKIDEYIATNIEKEVILGDPLAKVRDGNIFGEKISPILFADVIGLALRGTAKNPEKEGINLLPQGERGFIAKAKKEEPRALPQVKMKKEKIVEPRMPVKKEITRVFSLRPFFVPLIVLLLVSVIVLGYVVLKTKTYDVKVPPTEIGGETMGGELGAREKEGELSTDPKLPIEEKKDIVIEEEPIFVTVRDTPTGWLRVREGPATTNLEIAKIYPGEKYEVLEEKQGWYKIQLKDEKEGWASATYIKK
jgi:type IV pilus assembly protein PilM